MAHAKNLQSQTSSKKKYQDYYIIQHILSSFHHGCCTLLLHYMFTKTDGPFAVQMSPSFFLLPLIAAAFALLCYSGQWKSAVDTNLELCVAIGTLHLGRLEHNFLLYSGAPSPG